MMPYSIYEIYLTLHLLEMYYCSDPIEVRKKNQRNKNQKRIRSRSK